MNINQARIVSAVLFIFAVIFVMYGVALSQSLSVSIEPKGGTYDKRVMVQIKVKGVATGVFYIRDSKQGVNEPWRVYTGPFMLDGPGEYTIRAHAVDQNGTVKRADSQTYVIR